MYSQIKKIKLLKLYSENNIFNPIIFKDGVNIILGEKYDSKTATGSKTNGVGKSILIQFIDFCLLSDYKKSRLSKITKNILPEKENINLDLLIDKNKYTISRNKLNENSPNIIVNGILTNFPTLNEAKKYLSSIIFKNDNSETLPSFRTLLSIIIRDENSEFKDISKPYDLRIQKPEEYEPHLYLLNLSLESYKKTKEIIKNLKLLTKLINNEKKELTANNTKPLSQVRAEINNIDRDIKNIEASIDAYKTADNFRILETEIAFLEKEIKDKSSKLKVLRYELNIMKSLDKTESDEIDSKEIEILYNTYKKSLGSFVVKNLIETTEFNNRVENYQRMLLEEEKKEIIDKINILDNEKKKLDDEYSKKMKIFDTEGILQGLKFNFELYQEKRNIHNKTITSLENYQKYISQKAILNKEKSNELLTLNNLLINENKKITSFQNTLLDIHEYIMGNRECSFNISTIETTSSANNPLKITLRISDDGSHGIDRTKVFIYDVSLLFNEITKKRHPLFLIHDNIFETDEDTIIRSLNFLNSKLSTTEEEFQYIITLNKDSVEKNKKLKLDIKKYTIAIYTKKNKFLKQDYKEINRKFI